VPQPQQFASSSPYASEESTAIESLSSGQIDIEDAEDVAVVRRPDRQSQANKRSGRIRPCSREATAIQWSLPSSGRLSCKTFTHFTKIATFRIEWSLDHDEHHRISSVSASVLAMSCSSGTHRSIESHRSLTVGIHFASSERIADRVRKYIAVPHFCYCRTLFS